MNAPRHNPTQLTAWTWTWTWSSALLLSALLVTPVGADALLHLFQWHGPTPAAASERELPPGPRRKSEDDPAPAAQHVAPDPNADPEPLAAPAVLPAPRPITPATQTAPQATPVAPRHGFRSAALLAHIPPRAPPA